MKPGRHEGCVREGTAHDGALEDGGVHATLGERLSYSEHGGPEGGLECGARLSLASLELDVDTNGALREFAGVHGAVRAAVTPR